MKSTLLALLFLCSLPLLRAQECVLLGLFKQGSAITQVSYNAKGKEQTRTVIQSKKVSTDNGVVRAELFGEHFVKDKRESTVNYSATCENGLMSIDINAFVSGDTKDVFKKEDWKMEVVEATNLAYPAVLSPGLALPDGAFRVKFLSTKENVDLTGTMDMTMTNRKVVGKEKITTPAGTFEAWKINFESKNYLKVLIPIRFEFTAIEWYVPGFGPIKSEYYRRDKLYTTGLITEIKP
ncbi:MAG: hypothetical protein IT260_00925 [Saprospiraceae bacterium]|nr:hypothetical protein [Saprospiraceae bacterium]